MVFYKLLTSKALGAGHFRQPEFTFVISLLLTFIGGLGLAAAATPLVRALALRTGFLAQPSADRWHRRPVALLGGYAIASSWLVVVLLTVPLTPIAPLVAGALLMFALGALDDVMRYGAATKLVAQVVIASIMVHFAPDVFITGQPVLDRLLALTWIVGITNAFNLLDNMDGLSAGIAAIAALGYLVVLAGPVPSPLALALAALAGSALGFLVYNFQPASIFMGDSGSLFIGSLLGGAALFAAPELQSQLAPVAVIPLLILLIPIFDTAFVTITRRLAGRSPMVGGRDHLSHRLVALGISERTAVLALYVLSATGGALGICLLLVDVGFTSIFVAAYGILLAAIGIVLGHVEANAPPANPSRAPLVSDVAYRNRVYEVLLDVALLTLAYYAAFRFRFDGPEFEHFLTYFAASFPIVIGSQLAGLAAAGKYRQLWQRFGAPEILSLLKGIAIGVAGSILLVLYLYRFEGFSRIVFAVDAVLMAVLLVGSRLAITSVDEYLRKQRTRGRRVLIYGAGRGGTLLLRELLDNPSHQLTPVGFLDDAPSKQRLKVEGLPVLGRLEDLPGIVTSTGAMELIVSIRDIDRHRLGLVAALCREHNLRPRLMRFGLEDLGPVPHIRQQAR